MANGVKWCHPEDGEMHVSIVGNIESGVMRGADPVASFLGH